MQNQKNPPQKFNQYVEQPFGIGQMMAIKLMSSRMGNYQKPQYYPKDVTIDNVADMNNRLHLRGGYSQQERMIRDKRKSFDHACLYSYQGVVVKKIQDGRCLGDDPIQEPPTRGLINPDKNKVDYDDKILSVGFEAGFEPGTIFEWLRTNSYWLVYLQDLDEIAYFRGEIRRCDYIINWLDEDGNEKKTYAAIRGPVETKINFIQKHQVSIDEPNYSLHILMPKNEDTMKQFKRYSKFYLKTADDPDNDICWRVEATDSISTKGILEITAVEYYANETEDDVEKGLVKAFVQRKVEPELNPDVDIIGPTFIKPKIEYEYLVDTNARKGTWYLDGPKVPVQMEKFTTPSGTPGVKIKWLASYSGQFTLWYGDKNNGHYKDFSKVIVVESLF